MKRVLKIYILLLLIIIINASSFSQNYDKIAKKVFNIAEFTHWPHSSFSNPNAPFIIGIYGNSTCKKSFAAYNGQRIGNHTCKIVNYSSPIQISNCHILFIDTKSDLNKVFLNIRANYTLTIGNNQNNFIEKGGIINLMPQNHPIEFEINNKKAVKKNILISPQILRLAKIID